MGKEFAVINEALEMDADGVTYRPVVKKLFFVLRGNEANLTVEKEMCLTKLREGDEIVLEDIYYDFDKWDLRPLSIVRLNKAYDYMMRNPGVKLQLSSHTDSRATYEYNIRLSERRAKSCVDYLVKVKGIPASRLTWKGYGETRLVNGCSDGVPCSEEEHQMNRRTEIRVIKMP
jgi:outer membrane protein OmpA-like peptidoglycan-associated protein